MIAACLMSLQAAIGLGTRVFCCRLHLYRCSIVYWLSSFVACSVQGVVVAVVHLAGGAVFSQCAGVARVTNGVQFIPGTFDIPVGYWPEMNKLLAQCMLPATHSQPV